MPITEENKPNGRNPSAALARNPVERFFVLEGVVAAVIAINAVVLFLDGFRAVHEPYGQILLAVDYACLLFFVIEAALKIKLLGWKAYTYSAWNSFDFAIVVVSMPTLLIPFGVGAGIGWLTVFRLLRLFRFLRLMRFIPNLERMLEGAKRALKASVGVMAVLLLYNIVFGLASYYMFGQDLRFGRPQAEIMPEFADPLVSIYTMFKIFTIEGWYEMSDALAATAATPFEMHFVRLYFILAVVTGGLIILGILNAVFVDEMSSDLAEQTEEEVEEVQEDLHLLRDELRMRLDGIDAKLDALDKHRHG